MDGLRYLLNLIEFAFHAEKAFADQCKSDEKYKYNTQDMTSSD